ncbi:MAG: 3'-5' exoribonuclease [bacterium]|nr:3'-5' exoribonuclease [bacterium]
MTDTQKTPADEPAQTDIMIDLETWATTPNAAIRAGAIAAFNPVPDGAIVATLLFDARPSLDDQLEKGRCADHDTVMWWNKHTPLSTHMKRHTNCTARCHTTNEILNTIEIFFAPFISEDFITGRIWCRGRAQNGGFDTGIIRNLYRRTKHTNPPWAYHQEYDVRTLDALVQKVVPENPHDPQSDIEAQIKQTQNAIGLSLCTRCQ